MTAFPELIRQLLTEGRAVLRQRPQLGPEDRAAVLDHLARAFADHALDVAGPPVHFDPEAALACAERVAWACWFLVQRREPPEEVARRLAPPPPPATPAQHLSGDLTLRFLPAVHRRARALAADDSLTKGLEALLRAWPLSGVLADLTEAPPAPVELGGHPGLLLLYAERLAAQPRPAWAAGPPRPAVELVFSERGLPLPASP